LGVADMVGMQINNKIVRANRLIPNRLSIFHPPCHVYFELMYKPRQNIKK